MLNLDVKVLRTLGAEELATAFVWADKSPVNLVGCSPEVLLTLVLAIGLLLFLGLLHLTRLLLHSCLNLTVFGLLQQLLLVLLLSQPVEELVRLRQDLRNQGVLVEVLDVEDLSRQFVVLIGCHVDVRHQSLVQKEDAPVLLVVVLRLLEHWRLGCSLDRLQVFDADFLRGDGTNLK